MWEIFHVFSFIYPLLHPAEGVAVVALQEGRAYLMTQREEASGGGGASLCGLVQLLPLQLIPNATVMHISANNVTLVTLGKFSVT